MVKQQGGSDPEPMSARGLLGWLYDMSFTRHYAPQVIKAVYWLVTVFYSLVAIVALVRLVQEGRPVRIVIGIAIILAAYVVYLVLARIVLEVLVVIFQMGDDLSAIRATGAPAPGPASYPPASYPPAEPYFVPAPAPAPMPPMWGPTATPWPDQPHAPVLGPHLEETFGYGDDRGTSPAEAPPEEPLAGPGGGATGEDDYPPEADGPPWIV